MSIPSVTRFWEIFDKAIVQYHEYNILEHYPENPYKDGLDQLLWRKNWIDCIQWHTEDLIRDPDILPEYALELKRKIDSLNQDRTNIVEQLDDYFLHFFKDVIVKDNSGLNTESPAWVVDRLSILALKIYHMDIEAKRDDITENQKILNNNKLQILLEQKLDVTSALENLFQNINLGIVRMKVYRQMKMYNDDSLNPVLYSKNR